MLLRRPQALLAATLLVLLLPHAHAQQAAAPDGMHQRMDDLVHSVQDAVHDAEAAGQKREVVDLGQSLHLLESKFSSLRAAMQQELGAKADKFTSHAAVAKELMDGSTELVRGVVAQREELRSLSSDVREVESAIRAVREAMGNFERDVDELTKVLGDLHVSHNELKSAHQEARQSVHEIMSDTKRVGGKGHTWFYIMLMVEIAGFVLYLYLKRPGSNLAHKAYGKFG